jgi:gamma-glutamylcyclotransferase (GGCT)/AIG2-like uncharacterized protein YtfP
LQPPFGIGGMAISGGSIDKEGAAGRTTAPTAISEENEAMNKQKGIIYLAYGSNLNLEQMAYRCPNAKALGGTKLNGYRLLFRGAGCGAVATIEKHEGGSVPVLLWQITPTDEAALDRYEGYPYLYRKEMVRVRFEGKWLSAMVYIMNDGRPLGYPSTYYYDVIRQGYMDARFNLSVLAQAVKDSAARRQKTEV